MNSVSIIIVSFNTREPLERCLKSITRSAPTAETIVVDNGSSDGSAEMIHGCFPEVRLIAGQGNQGFAGGCNSGAAEAAGQNLLFLNSDCRVMPGSVEGLALALDENPRAGAVAGRLVDPAGETQEGFNVRMLPTIWSITADLLLFHRWLPANRLSAGYRMTGFDHAGSVEVEQPAGACLMIRRERFGALGGFDEAFHPAWFEDVDLCRRLKDSGDKIFFVPSAIFEHLGGATMRRLDFRRFTRMYYRNQAVYLRKHFGLAARFFLRTMIIAGMGLRSLLVLLTPFSFSGPVGTAGRVEAARAFLSVIPPTIFGWSRRQVS